METNLTQDNSIMSAKDWAISIFVSGLPLIGIIMLFVWAFSDTTNINKKNWAKGMLLIFVLAMAIGVIFMFFLGGMAMINGATME